MKLSLEQWYMLSILLSQYHACWCSGDCRSQCISRHGIVPQRQNIPSPASEELIHWTLELLLKCVIFKPNSEIDKLVISCWITLRWMSLGLINDKTMLNQVMVWCCQATGHYLNQCWPISMRLMIISVSDISHKHGLCNISCTCISVNSSDAGVGIFWFLESIPCLLLPLLLKSPGHQQAWYWLRRTDNMHCCSTVTFIYLGQAKPKIRLKMWIYLLESLK